MFTAFSIAALMACNGQAASADVNAGQAIVEMGDAINDLRQENVILQSQIDSLRGEVARQDTLLRRMASMTGMPMPTP